MATYFKALAWTIMAITLLAIIANGRVYFYIRAFWIPVLAVVSILILTLATSFLRQAWKQPTASSSQTKPPPITWLIIFPALLIVTCAPSPLGASMLTNTSSGTNAAQPSGVQTTPSLPTPGTPIAYAPLPEGEVTELTLEDLSDRYTFGDPHALLNKNIRIIGFVSHPNGNQSGEFIVNRYKIYCCAADAISYSATVKWNENFQQDQWVEIEGKVDDNSITGDLTVIANSVKIISEPKVPYL